MAGHSKSSLVQQAIIDGMNDKQFAKGYHRQHALERTRLMKLKASQSEVWRWLFKNQVSKLASKAAAMRAYRARAKLSAELAIGYNVPVRSTRS